MLTIDQNSPFKIFALYLRMIPPNGIFYRKPLDSVFAFGKQCVGINMLSNYMKHMYGEAGITTDNRNIVNHSRCVTCCTRLFNDGFDEQMITARSGHCSNTIRLYK